MRYSLVSWRLVSLDQPVCNSARQQLAEEDPLSPSDKQREMESGSLGKEDGSEGDTGGIGPTHSSYRCSYPDCGKQYSRASHLARHRQSHQDTKPHQCDICGKGFTRQDVLSRHKRRQHVEGGDNPVDEPDTPGQMDTEKDANIPGSAKDHTGTTPQDPWGFQYTPDKHTTTVTQADLRNIVLSSQANLVPDEPSQEQPSVPHPPFHHFAPSQSVPPAAPVAAPSTTSASGSYAWHSNNFDLDSMFFDASTFAPTPAVNVNSALNEDISSLFANWAMPGQPVIGANGQQVPDATVGNGVSNALLEIQNDDFMRWLSSDIGTSAGQPPLFATPEAPYSYVPLYEQTKPFVNNAEVAFQFNMSSERGGQSLHPNGRDSPAHPSLQHGIRTRPPSPTLPQQSENDTHWPMTWEPNRIEHDAGLSSNVMEFSDVHGVDDPAEDMSFITMDETCRLAMLELLHFAELPANAYHRLYVRLSRLPLSVLNNFLGIFFSEVHSYLPFLHKPTFDPRKCSGFLLTIMIALGAQMSKLSGARSFSYFLGDLVHAAFSKVVDADRILLREVKMLQTMLLWSFLRYNGLRRLMEMAEVFRGAYAVPLGRMHGFDDKIPFPSEIHDTSQALERRWQIWRAWETRRRTGFASLLSEAEFATLLNRPPVIVPREMQSRLPCSDDCWNAPNAHDWADIYFDKETSMQCSYYACDVVDGRPSVLRELAKGARRSAFASTVLIQMLHMNVWTVRQCGSNTSPTVRAMLQEIQRSLTMVACSENEFTPYQENRSSAWRGVAILYHYAQIASRIAVPTLLALAGKESAREAGDAQKALSEWLHGNPVSGREVALHAGQCWKLIRQGNLRATYGPFCLMYSALVLYTCSASPHFSQLDIEAMQHSSPEDDYITLDCERTGVMELNYIQTGLASVKLGDIHFTSPSAGRDILASARAFMEQNDSWGLTSGLSRVLAKVEERARSESQQQQQLQEGNSS